LHISGKSSTFAPPNLKKEVIMYYFDDYEDEFAGTYAHDEAGFSDEDIYDVFEGDPDAYWNID
jgi:hypothetical protein